MTALMTLPRLQPTAYPFSQLLKDLKDTIPSWFQKTSTVFSRAVVNKLDEQGNLRTLHYPNADTGEEHVKDSEFSYVLNKQTRKIYYDEPGFVISIKCWAAFCGIPIYILGHVLWNVYQIFRSIFIIAHNVYHRASEDFLYGRFYEVARILAQEINPFPSHLKERLLAIISAPLLGLGMWVSAALGVFRPLHGRQWVAMFDKALHDGATYRDHLFKVLVQKECTLASFCKDIHLGKECFLTYCFLDRGNVDDQQRFRLLREEPIRPYFG
jgi:hypothetical protein